jgi:REP element-mobilizing transposase RayT
MTYDLDRHHRRSIRLRGYDYTQAGAYFITICARHRACIFADIEAGSIRLTAVGEIATACWEVIPDHFPHADLDAFIVMPNHLHGIVVIGADPDVGLPGSSLPGTACRALLTNRFGPLPPGRIPSLWQANYFEHVVRNERSLNQLRSYIAANPARWMEDTLHPNNPNPPVPARSRAGGA